MSNSPRYEQETTICFNEEEKTAIVYTCRKCWIRRLDKLCEEFPEHFKLIKRDDISNTYQVSKKYVKINKPVIFSEKQKEVLRQRLNKIKNKQK